MSDQLQQLLKDEKFLMTVRRLALEHKFDAQPMGWSQELYQSMMWASGTIDALISKDFKIVKKGDENG